VGGTVDLGHYTRWCSDPRPRAKQNRPEAEDPGYQRDHATDKGYEPNDEQ
jgi:hypothetical protein